jgi:hypothetical protein
MKSYPVSLLAAMLLTATTAAAQGMMKGEQQRPPEMMKGDGVDLSALGLIDRAGSDTLVVNLKERIEEHNKMLTERFDKDKNGKLDEKEMAVMDYVLTMRPQRPPMPPQERRMPPMRHRGEMPPPEQPDGMAPPPEDAMQGDMPEPSTNENVKSQAASK